MRNVCPWNRQKGLPKGSTIKQRKWEKFTWNLQKLQMFLPSQKRLSENLESSLAFLKGDYNMFIGGIFKERFIVSCTCGNWSCLTDTFKLGGSTTTEIINSNNVWMWRNYAFQKIMRWIRKGLCLDIFLDMRGHTHSCCQPMWRSRGPHRLLMGLSLPSSEALSPPKKNI